MKNNKREVQGTINGIAEFLKNESYSSILDFNFLNDESTSTDFITEYYNKVNTLDNYHYQMELSIYTWLYELLEYSFCGNYKDKSKIEEYELECEMFCDLNQKNLHKKAFEILEFLNNRQKINPIFDGAKPEKQKKRPKTLLEFINNIDDKEAFLNDLKNTFPNEIGLSIKAIVLRLVEVNILIYGTKEFKNFYEELTKYFDRSIGTYGSINDNKPDSKIIDTITLKLNPLIDKYKTK